MKPVLVTRAEPGASRTMARLRARGMTAVNASTAVIAYRHAAPELDGTGALAFTSPNGVGAFAKACTRRDLPVLTVGAATAAAARDAGFAAVTSADGDGPALARLIAAAPPNGKLLHVTGAARGFDLAGALKERGLAADTAVLYDAQETRALTSETCAMLEAGAVILVHSPLGAARFAALVAAAGLNAALSRCDVAAISQNAAAPLADTPVNRVVVANSPDEDALLDALDTLASPAAR